MAEVAVAQVLGAGEEVVHGAGDLPRQHEADHQRDDLDDQEQRADDEPAPAAAPRRSSCRRGRPPRSPRCGRRSRQTLIRIADRRVLGRRSPSRRIEEHHPALHARRDTRADRLAVAAAGFERPAARQPGLRRRRAARRDLARGGCRSPRGCAARRSSTAAGRARPPRSARRRPAAPRRAPRAASCSPSAVASGLAAS